MTMGTAPGAAASPAAATPIAHPVGDYCAFNSTTGALACVDDESDYDVALRAAGAGGAPAGDPAGRAILGDLNDHVRSVRFS